MNLLDFRTFLNTIPRADLEVSMVASKEYDLGDGIETRLDAPTLDFFIDPDEKEACFIIKSDQAGFDQVVELMQKPNHDNETDTTTTRTSD